MHTCGWKMTYEICNELFTLNINTIIVLCKLMYSVAQSKRFSKIYMHKCEVVRQRRFYAKQCNDRNNLMALESYRTHHGRDKY